MRLRLTKAETIYGVALSIVVIAVTTQLTADASPHRRYRIAPAATCHTEKNPVYNPTDKLEVDQPIRFGKIFLLWAAHARCRGQGPAGCTLQTTIWIDTLLALNEVKSNACGLNIDTSGFDDITDLCDDGHPHRITYRGFDRDSGVQLFEHWIQINGGGQVVDWL